MNGVFMRFVAENKNAKKGKLKKQFAQMISAFPVIENGGVMRYQRLNLTGYG